MHDSAAGIDVDGDPRIVDGVAVAAHGIVGIAIEVVSIYVGVWNMGFDQITALVDGERRADIAVPWTYGHATSICRLQIG